MLTFTDQTAMCQAITSDSSASMLLNFKRDLNEGGAMFLNRLGRKFNKEYLTASIVSAQQYYTLSSGTLRISEVRVLNGTNYYKPDLVASEEEWDELNTVSQSGNIPTHYYIRGFNEIGLFPIPSAAVTNGLKISIEPQHVDLTQDDVTTGTVTVSNGSVTITHSGTSFTPQMVGRWIQITDGTDGKWYKIAGYSSTSVVTLENYYEGISGASRTFRIGEVMKIPNSYQMAPVYWALSNYYEAQNDPTLADRYEAKFDRKLKSAKETYGRSTSRLGVKSRIPKRRGRGWIDFTRSVTYP